MTDYNISPPRQASPPPAQSLPTPRVKKNFIITDDRLKKKFIMTDYNISPQPRQDTPRVKRNFIMTDTDIDNSPPLPLPAPRARKRVVKTYKFNKHLNYKRGLQILKKISE